MTIREFMTAVANANISNEMTNFAIAEINKMDTKNAKRRAKPSKAATSNAVALESLIGVMTSEPMTAGAAAKILGVTPQKANAILKAGVDAGRLTVDKVKSKSGKVNGYTKIETDADIAERESAEG